MKLGRNDPCYCGSGKKYKKCCLDKDNLEERERTKADLAPVIQWIYQNDELSNYLDMLIKEYFPDKAVTDKTDIDFYMLLDAFIFDYKIPSYDKTPFELYLKKAKLFSSEREDYEKLLNNIFSVFEVLKVERNTGMKLYDIINNKTYYIKEKKGTQGLKVGIMLNCRLAKIGNSFRIIGPGSYQWPSETIYLLKRFINEQKLKKKDKDISSFSILKIVLKEKHKPKTIDEIKNALKNKLKNLGIKINFNEIDKRINESITAEKAFPEIFKFNFPSNDDYKETLSLVTELWNSYPRKEFDGKSPQEKAEYGPKETMLIQSLFSEGTIKINPDNYSSSKEVKKAFESFKEKWLHKPQKELNGKTPIEVILKERAMLGNPRKDISIQIQLKKTKDFDANKAEKLYFDALAAEKSGNSEKSVDLLQKVVEMYPENYKAWGNMGASYASLGKKEDALKYLKKSLLINPKYKIAKRNLKIIEELSEKELIRKAKEITMLRKLGKKLRI